MAGERILVVEDEASARAALASLLTDEGYVVEQACDGQEGIEALERFNPSLVLSDMKMPAVSGRQLLERARENGSAALFILMSAFWPGNEREAVVRAGACTTLTKPLDLEATMASIRTALARAA